MVFIMHIIVCFLLSMQVIALYSCSRRIRIVLGANSIILGSIALVLIISRQHLPPPALAPGCFFGMSSTAAHKVAGAWLALFTYHSILFGCSMAKTWKARRATRIPLMGIVFRDGVLYYAVIALSLLTNILMYYLGGPYSRGGLSSFSSSVSSTMMARLLLNLLKVNTENSDANIADSDNTEDCSLPPDLSRVELDTIWSSDLEHRARSISL